MLVYRSSGTNVSGSFDALVMNKIAEEDKFSAKNKLFITPRMLQTAVNQ